MTSKLEEHIFICVSLILEVSKMDKTSTNRYVLTKSNDLFLSYLYFLNNRMKSTDFSRQRKLKFASVVGILLNFNKKSAQTEIDMFFEKFLNDEEPVSRQAFEKARLKVNYTAFLELFNVSVEGGLLPEDSSFLKGFRVIAVDGSTLMLEKSPELIEYFGSSTPSKGDAFARIGICYDVLNDFNLVGSIKPYATGEREMAIEMLKDIDKLQCKNNLFLFDRGYWSPDLMGNIIENGNKFLMRASINSNSTITNNVSNSGFFKKKCKDKIQTLRYYKFKLSSGEQEILVTNLSEAEFPDEELSKLYFMRWGVETKYQELKTRLQWENFSGKSVLAVMQDFYCTLYLSNLISFFKYNSDEIIKEERAEKNNKYDYKTNTNYSIGILKNALVCVLFEPNGVLRQEMLNKIVDKMSRNPIPIKPDRKAPRKQNRTKQRRFSRLKVNL